MRDSFAPNSTTETSTRVVLWMWNAITISTLTWEIKALWRQPARLLQSHCTIVRHYPWINNHSHRTNTTEKQWFLMRVILADWNSSSRSKFADLTLFTFLLLKCTSRQHSLKRKWFHFFPTDKICLTHADASHCCFHLIIYDQLQREAAFKSIQKERSYIFQALPRQATDQLWVTDDTGLYSHRWCKWHHNTEESHMLQLSDTDLSTLACVVQYKSVHEQQFWSVR